MEPSRQTRHHHSKRPPLREALLSLVGGVAGIGTLGLVDQLVLGDRDLTLVIGAFGATAVLVFGAPTSPFAQPWNVVVGHVVSATIGVAVVSLLGPGWLAAALAVGLAIFAMQMSRSLHPPGGASALIAVAGSAKLHALGWLYPVFPVGAGAVILVAVALGLHRLRPGPRYPLYWY